MENTIDSQEKQILKHLQKGLKINPIWALHKFGCLRLGARIFDLKEKGHNIRTNIVYKELNGKKVKKYAEYYLIEDLPHTELS